MLQSTVVVAQKAPRDALINVRWQDIISRSVKCLAVLGAVWLIVGLADNCKGYQVTPLRGETVRYQIDVEVNREQAQKYYERMTQNKTDVWAVRDVRLPNGVLTVATVSLDEVVTFLQSEAAKMTASRVWSANEHRRAQINEDDNRVTVFVWIDYKTLLKAIEEAKADPSGKCLLRQDINLPEGQRGCCILSLDEMEEYRRRMHTQGATQIVLPLYFSLDMVKPALNIPMVDRLA